MARIARRATRGSDGLNADSHASDTIEAKRKPSLFAIRRSLVYIFAAAAVSPTVLATFARWSYVADLAANFRVQVMWLSLAMALALLAAGRRWPALVVAAAAGWNAWLIGPCYFPTQRAVGRELGPTRRILYANIYRDNADLNALLDLIEREDPDTIILVEVTPHLADSLAKLRDRYPHLLEEPARDAFGIAFYSRLPTEFDRDGANLGPGANRTILGVQSEAGRSLKILGMHPPPPVSPAMAKRRNDQLAAAAERSKSSASEKIVVGDFNITPWSPYFSHMLQASGLRDSRRGFGVQASWPADRWWLRIPIDHCLHSDGVVIRNRRFGPPIGSDHLPVIVDYAAARGD